MTLDKHTIQGVAAFTTKTLPSNEFEKRMIDAGYNEVGSAPAQGGRIKVWWLHNRHLRNIKKSGKIISNPPLSRVRK